MGDNLGHQVAWLVQAMRCKPEGIFFDSGWGVIGLSH